MAKLQTTEKIVLEVLEASPEARQDDYILMLLVSDKMGVELTTTFREALLFHKERGLPNWHSVTRSRRKLQRKFPYLKDPKTTIHRENEQEEYREYARS